MFNVELSFLASVQTPGRESMHLQAVDSDHTLCPCVKSGCSVYAGGTAREKWASRLNSLDLDLDLHSVELRARLSDEVSWGASLLRAQAALQPQSGSILDVQLLLNDQGAPDCRGTVLHPIF